MSDKVVFKLHTTRFHKTADTVRTVRFVSLPEGVPLESLLVPEAWAHVGKFMQPRDIIEVWPDDGSFRAELVVRDCGQLWAKVEVLSRKDFGEVESKSDDPQYEVVYAGPHHKHRVVRVSDKEVIRHGFETKDAAQDWLKNHQKALAA
jgi:hypothetical protein